MAELVVGAFLSVMLEKLFEKLTSTELRQSFIASKLNKLVKKLKRATLLLNDAEDRQFFEKEVKEWLDELKHVVFLAYELVEEINDSKKEPTSKRNLAGKVKSFYHWLANTVQGEIDSISEYLEDLLERAGVLDLKRINTSMPQNRRPARTIIAHLPEEHHVFGRETEKEKILEMLLSEEDKIRVLPIVGMGGIGKTTLAQIVYNDKRVEEHGFTLKAWVTVSTEFNFCRIIKELLKKVNPGTSTSDINEPNELQLLMKEAVRGKKFLFVLDDVWEENYDSWDLLMSNFTARDRRSRVIVTTQSRAMGSILKMGPIHELKEVHKDDCWRIFVHHVFNGETNIDCQLKEIGERIVAKCKGLPLAVKSIGGLLRSEINPEKWEKILSNDVCYWRTDQKENGVLPSLWLSYCDLSSTLKLCFAYCSIFPQDFKFRKEQMVLLWMAEGFLPSDEKDKRTEEVGEQCFDDLVSRSLFQRSSEDKDRFVMHDLVHDLAAFVYDQFCFRMGDDLKNVTIRTRHLYSDQSYEKDNDLLTGLSKAEHLRTFLHSRSLPDDFVKEMATKMRFVRVLSLCLESESAGDSICSLSRLEKLVKLRYLDLSYSQMKELPDSICSLFHLQTLILDYCTSLIRLPTDIGKLVKLRYLDLSHSRIEELPDSICCLLHLQTLILYRTFLIRLPTDIGKLVKLRYLDLSYSMIEELPDSICSLFHLQTLRLWYCRKLTRLPTEMRKLTKLRHLHNSFTRLKKMPLNMGKLKELRILTYFVLGEDEGSGFSSLKELGELHHLGATLWISKLQNVRNLEDIQNANILRDKAEIKLLALQWKRDTENVGFSENVLEALRPHPNLEGLKVFFYPGSSFPKWVGETSFSKMVFMWLMGKGSLCRFFPPLGQLPSLKELKIEGFEGVEKIGNEFLYGNDNNSSITPFPSLESLSFKDMSNWKECSFVGHGSGCFPRLERLILERCPKLESITEDDNRPQMESTKHQHLASLHHLWIDECPLLETRYKRNKGEDWHYISHIPDITIKGKTTIELEREEEERRQWENSASQNV